MSYKRQPNALQVAALEYAKQGWSVFPARFIGKQKLGWTSAEKSNGNSWGYSKDPDEIREYWRQWPNAAIGLPTGAVNGLFVIDLDTIEGHGVDGHESLMSLQVKHYNGDWPRTKMTESPTGSRHHYFKYPPGLIIPSTAGELGPGIDVRGDGGFVIAPPSIRPGRGAYKRITYCGIADAPRWLLNLVAKKAAPVSKAFDPVLMAMMRADAGMGISFDPDDCFADDVDIELKIRVALSVIPSDEYDVWFRIGAAIHDGLGDAGFALFEEWSQGSSKYNARECERKWRDVSAMRSITVATIFHHADQHNPDWRDLYRQLLREEVAA